MCLRNRTDGCSASDETIFPTQHLLHRSALQLHKYRLAQHHPRVSFGQQNLGWHTQVEPVGDDVKRFFMENNVGVSTKLLRYWVYLLVSRPDLLPLHPDIARAMHMDVHNELIALANFDYNTIKTYTNLSTLFQGLN